MWRIDMEHKTQILVTQKNRTCYIELVQYITQYNVYIVNYYKLIEISSM